MNAAMNPCRSASSIGRAGSAGGVFVAGAGLASDPGLASVAPVDGFGAGDFDSVFGPPFASATGAAGDADSGAAGDADSGAASDAGAAFGSTAVAACPVPSPLAAGVLAEEVAVCSAAPDAEAGPAPDAGAEAVVEAAADVSAGEGEAAGSLRADMLRERPPVPADFAPAAVGSTGICCSDTNFSPLAHTTGSGGLGIVCRDRSPLFRRPDDTVILAAKLSSDLNEL
jgi:hypothetical protein